MRGKERDGKEMQFYENYMYMYILQMSDRQLTGNNLLEVDNVCTV